MTEDTIPPWADFYMPDTPQRDVQSKRYKTVPTPPLALPPSVLRSNRGLRIDLRGVISYVMSPVVCFRAVVMLVVVLLLCRCVAVDLSRFRVAAGG